ncbi:venom allergen 5-like [Amblyomma americanum]
MATMEATCALILALLTMANNMEPAAAVQFATFKDFLAILRPRASYPTHCDVTTPGLTPEDEKELLKKHNDLRSSIAGGKVDKFPKPAGMNMLEWDKDLATKAQETANSCDPTKQVEDAAAGITQNTGSAKATDPAAKNGMAVIENWIKGKEKFDVAALDKYAKPSDADAERFSQIIWGMTAHVGCGYLRFKNKAQPTEDPQEILVCNYKPGGRKDGKPVYEKGEPCSKCEDGRKCDDETKLCKTAGGGSGDSTDQRTEEGGSGMAVVGIIAAVIAVGVVVAGVALMQSSGNAAAAAAAPAADAGAAEGAEAGLAGGESALAGGAGDEGGEGAAAEAPKDKPEGAEGAGSQEAIAKANG